MNLISDYINPLAGTIFFTIFRSLYKYIYAIHDNTPLAGEPIAKIATARFIQFDEITSQNLRSTAQMLSNFQRKFPNTNITKIDNINMLPPDDTVAGIVKHRKTDRYSVCLSVYLLDGSFSIDEIRAAIAHELAHVLLNHDSNIWFFSRNLSYDWFVATFYLLFEFYLKLIILRYGDKELASNLFCLVGLGLALLAFTQWNSRQKEFEADKESLQFSNDSTNLCTLLDKMDKERPKNYWPMFNLINLMDSHPCSKDRIQRLQELGHGSNPVNTRPGGSQDTCVNRTFHF